MMPILPPFLRRLLAKRRNRDKPRTFLSDEQAAVWVKRMAAVQHREEQDVYDEIIAAGMKAVEDKDRYAAIWDVLSPREQQVTALLCLGYRSDEMAGMLGVSYETIRTHCKHVYAKFGLNKRELRLALKDWDFQEWMQGGNREA
jgi:DNA-binding CsgD family transcriptional regulator